MAELVPNSIYYILRSIKLMILFQIPNSSNITKEIKELGTDFVPNSRDWRAVGEILHTDTLRETAFYFLDYGAATSHILRNELKHNKRMVSRNLETLRDFGVIQPAAKLRAPHGRPPTVYQTPDATIDQIREAYELHRKLRYPKYRVAQDFAQILLEEYIPRDRMEITYKEIVVQKKVRGIPFNTSDIADLTAKCLHDRGVRIWR